MMSENVQWREEMTASGAHKDEGMIPTEPEEQATRRESRARHDVTVVQKSTTMAVFCNFIRSITVEPPLFLYMLCLYYLIPAANSLYLYKVCRTIHNYDKSLCESLVRANFSSNMSAEEHVVSEDTSAWMFYQTIVFTIPSTIVTLLMGIYGDKKGRRLPLMSPFVGQGVGCAYYLLMALYEDLHVKYMLFGALITGLSGGFACVIMASNSHLSVVHEPEQRTMRLVGLQAVMRLGTMLGCFTVGVINNPSGDLRMGWVTTYACIIILTAIGLIYLVVRFWNSPPPSTAYMNINNQEQQTSALQSINILKVFSTVCHGFPSILQLTFVAIWLAWITGLGEFDVLYSYAQRMKLDLSIYGYYNGFSAGVQAIAGAISVVIFKRMCNVSDPVIALIGLFSGAMELLLLAISGLVGDGTDVGFLVLWWLSPLTGMFKLVGPSSLRAIASFLVPVDSQSKLFSFISASDGILQLLTSALYNYILWHFTEKYLPSASFFVSFTILLVSISCASGIYRRLKTRPAAEPSTVQ